VLAGQLQDGDRRLPLLAPSCVETEPAGIVFVYVPGSEAVALTEIVQVAPAPTLPR